MSTFFCAVLAERGAVPEAAFARALASVRLDSGPRCAWIAARLSTADAWFFAMDLTGRDRWDLIGFGETMIDPKQSELLASLARAGAGRATFGVVYTDMSRYRRAWRVDGDGWEMRSLEDDLGFRTTHAGVVESRSTLPDLRRFPDEDANLAEQARLEAPFDPLRWISESIGVGRKDLLDLSAAPGLVVTWSSHTRPDPSSQFDRWLRGLRGA